MIKVNSYIIQNTGKSHLQRGKDCQDAAYLKELENGHIIAAVCDGVGSCAHADIGAKLACKKAVEFCANNMPIQYTEEDILSLIRVAYNQALKSIFEYADKEELPINELDTTLSLAIFDGSTCYYGQAGDSMIVGLTPYGEYLPITKRQKGSDFTSVRPLRAGSESWEFGITHQAFISIAVMSDGVYDLLTPPLIQENGKDDILYPFEAMMLLDPRIIDHYGDQYISMVKQYISGDLEEKVYYDMLLEILKESQNRDELITKIKQYNMPLNLVKRAYDDQTIVILSSTIQEINQLSSIEFEEPDWEELLRKQRAFLYPDPDSESEEKKQDKMDAVSECNLPENFAKNFMKESAEIIKILLSK